jgi:hypothetical protein
MRCSGEPVSPLNRDDISQSYHRFKFHNGKRGLSATFIVDCGGFPIKPGMTVVVGGLIFFYIAFNMRLAKNLKI